MTKKPHSKSVGETGAVRVSNQNGIPLVTWERIAFPDNKSAQELLVAESFVRILRQIEGKDASVLQLKENDFDFLLREENGDIYLELQEIVIRAKRVSPYSSKEQIIQSEKFATTITSETTKKVIKYSGKQDRSTDLLIYDTHWQFSLSATVKKLVAYWLATKAHPFRRVHHLSMHDQNSGTVELLFPNAKILAGFHPRQAAGHKYVNFDPALALPLTQEDGSIGVKFELPPDLLKKLMAR